MIQRTLVQIEIGLCNDLTAAISVDIGARCLLKAYFVVCQRELTGQ